VTAPKDAREMLGLLRAGLAHATGPFSIRYPRDSAPDSVPSVSEIAAIAPATWDVLRRGSEVAILAVGTMVLPAVAAAERLAADGLDVTVVNCRFLKPYDQLTLSALLTTHRNLLVVEEGTVVNGFGAFMAREVGRLDGGVRVHTHGVPDRFIEQSSRKRQLASVGLDADGIADRVRALLETESLAG
jgi:1-deoxy-D-xylulose-5-phosphate synthase